MLDTQGFRVFAVRTKGDPRGVVSREGQSCWTDHHDHGDLPDLEDPATLGCFVFELLPKAWGDDYSVLANADGYAEIFHMPTANAAFMRTADTLGEALVAALEAAPSPL